MAGFITFEGIDGSGKSSHMKRVAELITDAGHEVVVTREPGGTELAEIVRSMVLEQAMGPLTELLLVFAARRDHVERCLRSAFARGAFVLCDRFTDSTYAYQGAGRGADQAVIAQLEAWVQEGLQPDLTLVFDIPPEVAVARRGAVRAADRFEVLPALFFAKVRDAYLARALQHPRRFRVIDSNREHEAVWAQVREAVAQRLEALSRPQR